jgi:hypothetical protein
MLGSMCHQQELNSYHANTYCKVLMFQMQEQGHKTKHNSTNTSRSRIGLQGHNHNTSHTTWTKMLHRSLMHLHYHIDHHACIYMQTSRTRSAHRQHSGAAKHNQYTYKDASKIQSVVMAEAVLPA